MAINTYKKGPVQHNQRRFDHPEEIIITSREKAPLTLGKAYDGVKNDLHDLLTTSRLASLFIPMILVLAGVLILYKQISPGVEQKLKEATGYYDQGTVALVEGEYLSARDQYLSNPGSRYFQQLNSDAFSQHILQEDPVSNNYKNTFYLTIKSLGLNRLAVTPNVDSGVEDVYRSVLQNTLAHFDGTGLPISSVQNNMVIYGHSATGDYFDRTADKVAAFSRLSELKIGDEVEIEMEGKTYKYKVAKSKIVEPTDTSIITGTPNKQTLTLFTCYPNGSNGKRYVAIAKPVE